MMSPTPITVIQPHDLVVDNNRTQTASGDISETCTPSKVVSTVDVRETSSDVGTFRSNKPRKVFLASSPSPTPLFQRKQKRKLRLIIPSPKKKCHSTSTKPVNNPYLKEGHPESQKNSKFAILHLKNSVISIFNLHV